MLIPLENHNSVEQCALTCLFVYLPCCLSFFEAALVAIGHCQYMGCEAPFCGRVESQRSHSEVAGRFIKLCLAAPTCVSFLCFPFT